MNIVPKEYFGVVERFSVFAAVGYNAVLFAPCHILISYMNAIMK